MAIASAISWTKSTFNAWIGCTHVGLGCVSCYAEALDARHKFGGATHFGVGVPRMRTSDSYWRQPLKWNEQARKTGEFWPVFCCSLADVFDNEVDPKWRADLFALIELTPHLTWQLVTKRIGNVIRMAPIGYKWPKNVWLIATMVNQEEFDRDWPKLRDVPATVRGLSVEPQLGRILFSDDVRGNLHWVIYGGESKQGKNPARECKYEWIAIGIDQCRRYGITPFVKQMGNNITILCQPMRFTGKGADPSEWPPEVRVQEFPK